MVSASEEAYLLELARAVEAMSPAEIERIVKPSRFDGWMDSVQKWVTHAMALLLFPEVALPYAMAGGMDFACGWFLAVTWDYEPAGPFLWTGSGSHSSGLYPVLKLTHRLAR